MSEKKVVGRNIALGIGLLCIVLLVAIAGVVIIYASMLSKKNSEIADLQNQAVSDNSTINRLTAIVDLSNSTVWVNHESVNQTAQNFTSWSFSVSYSGYVVVDVQYSSINNTGVELKYSWNGINYDNRVNVGSGGQASFPVLPANNISVRVINNSSTSALETVTITYWY